MYPIVVVLLDGLADRAHDVLKGRTANEAARTPNLDRFAAAGSCGLLYAVGPGRAPSSEVAHWAMLGYRPDEFPGRAVFEALGRGQARLGRARLRLRRAAAGRAARRRLVADRPSRPEARRRRREGARRRVRRARGRPAALHARSTSGAARRCCGSRAGPTSASPTRDAFFRDRHPGAAAAAARARGGANRARRGGVDALDDGAPRRARDHEAPRGRAACRCSTSSR